MTRWFRFYDDAVNDPKVQRLPGEKFKAWVNMLCLASRNNGVLPPLDDISFTLRISKDKISTLLDEFCSAGLLDPVEVEDAPMSYEPHNWNGRQFLSDKKDATVTARMKRYRERKRNNRNAPVTMLRPETDNRTDTDVDDAVDARAKPLVSSEAIALADELLVIAGHKLEFVPPGWCGAAMRVQAWLAEWPKEIILAAVKGAAARKRGPPANSVQFFENAVAEEFARQSAPLPKVEVHEAKTLTVTHGKPQNRSGGSLLDAIDRRIAEAELAAKPDPALPADSVLRIPDRSIC